jgi:protein TonB
MFTAGEVDRKAIIVWKTEPMYTEEARQNRVTGTVVLRAVLSSRGSVINIKNMSELPHGLTENSVSATRKMKFIPAMKDGKYVSCWIQLEFNFSLF